MSSLSGGKFGFYFGLTEERFALREEQFPGSTIEVIHDMRPFLGFDFVRGPVHEGPSGRREILEFSPHPFEMRLEDTWFK